MTNSEFIEGFELNQFLIWLQQQSATVPLPHEQRKRQNLIMRYLKHKREQEYAAIRKAKGQA